MKRELETRWGNLDIHYHEWIRFHDANGTGHAEPEAYLVLKDRIVLFEAKLTGGIAGKMQMEGLYKPLLENIYRRPVVCLMICKNVAPDTPHPRYDSPEAFMSSGRPFGVWHWLG